MVYWIRFDFGGIESEGSSSDIEASSLFVYWLPRNFLNTLQGRPPRLRRTEVVGNRKQVVDSCEDRAISAIGGFRPEVVICVETM